jgi:hypothetical protein
MVVVADVFPEQILKVVVFQNYGRKRNSVILRFDGCQMMSADSAEALVSGFLDGFDRVRVRRNGKKPVKLPRWADSSAIEVRTVRRTIDGMVCSDHVAVEVVNETEAKTAMAISGSLSPY